VDPPVSVEKKRFKEKLNPSESILMKNMGEGGVMVN
jgi:hypothetical protein